MNSTKIRHTKTNCGIKTHGAAVSGFTLIELLVVISIIAVLAALILNALQGARRSAYELKSLNAVRNVAQANISYSGDNNGQINTVKDPTDTLYGKPGWVTDTFWGRLAPYLFKGIQADDQTELQVQIRAQLAILFDCPGINKDPSNWKGTPFENVLIYADVSGLPIPFGFNKYLVKYKDWVLRQQVPSPASTILFTYGRFLFDEDDGLTYIEMPKIGGAKPTCNIYYLPSEKTLAAYLDGRVAYIEPTIAPEQIKFEGAEDK
jgi:prepilin-type N-terminal cleavage/methylation domain-containing protein